MDTEYMTVKLKKYSLGTVVGSEIPGKREIKSYYQPFITVVRVYKQ